MAKGLKITLDSTWSVIEIEGEGRYGVEKYDYFSVLQSILSPKQLYETEGNDKSYRLSKRGEAKLREFIASGKVKKA